MTEQKDWIDKLRDDLEINLDLWDSYYDRIIELIKQNLSTQSNVVEIEKVVRIWTSIIDGVEIKKISRLFTVYQLNIESSNQNNR
jgi:hypothetical protein